jgi:hypothetical protein
VAVSRSIPQASANRSAAITTSANSSASCASAVEIEILLSERVELNAMTSEALVEMIERKLKDYGLQKVIPDDDLLGEAYLAFHRSKEMQEKFEEMESEFEESKIKVPKNLGNQVHKILAKHPDLRWDDAIRIVLDGSQLDHVREEKQKARRKSGDFTGIDEDEEDDE